jgi:putative methionine-R-sulfoxide reductase with GAF domain
VVVPIHDAEGHPIGVLDIDSHREGHFDKVDGEGCRIVVEILEKTWNTVSSATYQRT